MQPDTPEILRQYWTQSWKAYNELPYPTLKDEEWRRTSLREFDIDDFQLANGEVIDQDRERDHLLDPLTRSQKGGSAVMDHQVRIQLTPELEDVGVIFSDIRTAAREHPEKLEKILGQVVDPGDGKFAALTGAFARNGLFIYVPRGVRLEKSLQSIFWAAGENMAHFSLILIYLEKNASLTYIHETSSPEEQTRPSLVGENVEIYVGPGSHLKFIELQTLGKNMWSFGHQKARVDQDGNLDWVIAALGSRLSKHFVSVDLEGQGADGKVSGLFFGDDNQHLSYNTRQNHLAPRTFSDLLFKGALTGASRSVWRGMIYVAPEGQYIDGYQANRNLVLGKAARSDSIPGLEILNNDVRCTHGSTVGKIDEEQLFYLKARGIPRQQAVRLIVHGFFEEIMQRIPFESVQARLNEAIDHKLSWSA